jgi:short-chain fatty acids transporter
VACSPAFLPGQKPAGGETLLKKIARSSDSVVERYLPDPFILVLILTLIVFVADILVQGQGPLAMIRH